MGKLEKGWWEWGNGEDGECGEGVMRRWLRWGR